jgi:hypothetical protein
MGIHLNWELGKIGRFRIVVSPFAKVFWCAGSVNGTTDASTTLNGAVAALDKTIITAADKSTPVTAGTGQLWLVGDIETGSTFYPQNEVFHPISAATVTITIAGMGDNGGLRYAHATGKTVSNADHVYPIVFGGPESLVKVYAVETGPYGKVGDPKVSGLLDQFNSLGWKYYGQYNRISENRILRLEVTSSYEA